MNVEHVVTTLGGDASPFLEEIRKMKAAVKDMAASVQAELQGLSNQVKDVGASGFRSMGADHKAAFSSLKKEIKEAEEAYKALNREVRQTAYTPRSGERHKGLVEINDTLKATKGAALLASQALHAYTQELDGAGKAAQRAMDAHARGVAGMMRTRASMISQGTYGQSTNLHPLDTYAHQFLDRSPKSYKGGTNLVPSPNPYGINDWRSFMGVGSGEAPFRRPSGVGFGGGGTPPLAASMSFNDLVELYKGMGLSKKDAEAYASRTKGMYNQNRKGAGGGVDSGGTGYPPLYTGNNPYAMVPYDRNRSLVPYDPNSPDNWVRSYMRGISPGAARGVPTVGEGYWPGTDSLGVHPRDRAKNAPLGFDTYGRSGIFKTPRADSLELDKAARAATGGDFRISDLADTRVGRGISSMLGGLKSGLGSMAGALQRLQSSVNPVNALLDVFNSRFMKILAVGAAIGFAGYMVHTGLKSAMDYQDNVTAMGVMLGSPVRGREMTDRIQGFARSSPFGQSSLFQSARTLSGYGVSERNILPSLKALGEVTAASGGGTERYQRLSLAFGQVISKGFLKGEELRQFANAGVGIKAFADAIDVTTPKLLSMMRSGQVESDILIKAFNKLTQEGGKFGGVMEQSMKNARGRVTFIENQFELGLQNAGLKFLESMDKHGGFDMVEGWAAEFRMVTEEMGSWEEIGKGFTTILVGIRSGFENAWMIVKGITNSMGQWNSSTQEEATTFEKIVGLIAMIPAIISDLVTGIRAIGLEIRAFAAGAKDMFSMTGNSTSRKAGEAYQNKANAMWGHVGEASEASFNNYFNALDKKKRGDFASPAVKGYIKAQKGIMSSIGPLEIQGDSDGMPQRLEKFFENLEHHGGESGHGFGSSLHSANEVFRTANDLYENSVYGRAKKIRDANENYERNKSFLEQFEKAAGFDDSHPDPDKRRPAMGREEQNEYQYRLMAVKKSQDAYNSLLGKNRFIDEETFGEGALGLLGGLRSHFKHEAPRQPEANVFGSVAAQDSINAARLNSGKNIEQEFKELFEQMVKELTENKLLAIEAGKALRAIAEKNPKILSMPVNGK